MISVAKIIEGLWLVPIFKDRVSWIKKYQLRWNEALLGLFVLKFCQRTLRTANVPAVMLNPSGTQMSVLVPTQGEAGEFEEDLKYNHNNE